MSNFEQMPVKIWLQWQHNVPYIMTCLANLTQINLADLRWRMFGNHGMC